MRERVAIVCALEREVAGLVRGWERTQAESQGFSLTFFEGQYAAAVVGGMGVKAARAASDALLRHMGGKAALLVSAGLAGALKPNHKVGEVVLPREVVDVTDGFRIPAQGEAGTLLTYSTVASRERKQELAREYPEAVAIDMEAYAVADVARIHGIPFAAVKTISDEAALAMPPLGMFIDDGRFQTGKFALYAAMRPWMWPSVIALDRNSRVASEALCNQLRRLIPAGAAAARP